MPTACRICARPLNRPDDPLSVDCGGDCWGCIGEAEYASGIGEPDRSRIDGEIAAGLRGENGEACGDETVLPWIDASDGDTVMKFEYIASFKKGDPVPAWLIDLEPDEPGGSRPTLRFGFDCHVTEVSQGLFVVPDNETDAQSCYFCHDAHNGISISAASRTVITPMRYMIFHGPDDKRGVEDAPIQPSGGLGA